MVISLGVSQNALESWPPALLSDSLTLTTNIKQAHCNDTVNNSSTSCPKARAVIMVVPF